MYVLSYRVEPKHWDELLRAARKRVRARLRGAKGGRTRKILLAIVSGATIGLLAVSAEKVLGLDTVSILVGLVGTVLAIFVLGPLVSRSSAQQLLRDDGMFMGQVELTANEEKVILNGRHFSSSYDWPLFLELSKLADTLVLWSDPSGGIVIPRSAFSSADNEDAFIAFANARIQASGEA